MVVSCYPAVQAPTELSYFTAISALVIAVVVTFGNILIILAVLIDPFKKLRSPFTFFLVNLAVCDLSVGLITLPFSYAAHITEVDGSIPEYLVTSFHLSTFISATASVLSLGALCVDRFVAIKWPIRYRNSLSMRRCVFISIIIWVFSGCISLLYISTGYLDYLMIFAHVAVLVTFAILVITYRQIYLLLRNRQDEIRKLQGRQRASDEAKTVSREKKATRAFLYILGLFICSFLPAVVMIYILQFCDSCSCDFRHVLRDLILVLAFMNSAANPFICTIRLKPFRKAVLAILKCRFRQPNAYSFDGAARGSDGNENQRSSTITLSSMNNK